MLDLPADLNELSIEDEGISPPEKARKGIVIWLHEILTWWTKLK